MAKGTRQKLVQATRHKAIRKDGRPRKGSVKSRGGSRRQLSRYQGLKGIIGSR